jgi:hypothetical protein
MRVRKKAVRSWYARKTMFDVRTSRLVSAAMVSALVSALALVLVNKMLVNKLVTTETAVFSGIQGAGIQSGIHRNQGFQSLGFQSGFHANRHWRMDKQSTGKQRGKQRKGCFPLHL